MGIPATLSSVPEQTPYIQYTATAGQTVFPYPFVITQDSDLIVVDNGVTLSTDQGYTVSNVGNATGGNVTFTSGANAGDIITLYRDIPIERITQIGQNSGFSSSAFNAEYNNIYLLLQQLQDSINFCLQVPITNTLSGAGNVLTPLLYSNKYLAFDVNGNPFPAALTPTGGFAQTLAEQQAGVNPIQLVYPPGNVFRYMSQVQINDVRAGTLGQDVTAAIQNAINSIPQTPYTLNGSYVTFPGTTGGGTVFFPDGAYKITSSLVIPVASYQIRLTGSWGAALTMVGTTSFDLIKFAAVPNGIVNLINGTIDNLRLVGAGSVSGSGNLINTQYVGNLQLKDLFLCQIPTGGDGIHVIGNPNGGTTYSHDILISNIYYETTTGNRIIYLGPTSADSIIEKVVGNGNAIGGQTSACANYGIYADAGSSHHKISKCHTYGMATNALYLGAVGSGHWIDGSRFEAGLSDSAFLDGADNCLFTDCQFTYPPAANACLSIENSSYNRFVNCSFVSSGSDSSTGSGYAIYESGTSNHNTFSNFVTEDAFINNPAFVLCGTNSALRPGGTDVTFSGGPLAITAGSTIYLTSGAAANTSTGSPVVYEGYATQLLIECDTAPGTGHTFTATLLLNGVPSALTATISGTGTAQSGTAVVYVPAGESVVVKVVASSGASSSNIRTCLVIGS